MARQTKRTEPVRMVGANLSESLWERLDKYSDKHGVSKRFIISQALTDYLDSVGAEVVEPAVDGGND